MRTDSLTIDKSALMCVLNDEYSLEIAALSFVPKGEDSYSYLAETREGARYFAKVHDPRRSANAGDLERALAVVHHLRTRCGLRFVVGLHLTKRGRVLSDFGSYRVALFDFLEGATHYEAPFNGENQARVAQMLARLHQCGRFACPGLPTPQVETFTLPCKGQLLSVLKRAGDEVLNQSETQQRVSALLRREREDILAAVERTEQLGQWVRANHAPVLIHGEPSSGNLLKTATGELYLLDWGEVALGPTEHDLALFTGEGFETFLSHYVSALETMPALHAEAFEFYFYHWTLSEIADWCNRLLLEERSIIEIETALSELGDYLPIQHAKIAEAVREVRLVLQQVLKA